MSGGAAPLSLRLAIGAFAGSSLGKAMDAVWLLFLFSVAMLVVGTLMLRPRRPHATKVRPVDRRMCLIRAIVAIAPGCASGFFGIGDGFLIVPGLMPATGMPMINAVGSSLLASELSACHGNLLRPVRVDRTATRSRVH